MYIDIIEGAISVPRVFFLVRVYRDIIGYLKTRKLGPNYCAYIDSQFTIRLELPLHKTPAGENVRKRLVWGMKNRSKTACVFNKKLCRT